MKIGRREILLLSSLGFVIYLFIGINFVWIDFFTGFEVVNSEYAEAKSEYDALEKETKNIEILKDDLNGVKLSSERLNQYVADNNSVIDAIVYLNKLSGLATAGLSNISISSPEIINIGEEDTKSKSNNSGEESKSEETYLKHDIQFTTTMTYEKYKELISYIEGAAKKVTISQIDIKPISIKDKTKKEEILTNNLDIKMNLELYSLGLLESNYENTYNFNSFTESDGGVLKIDNLDDIEDIDEIIEEAEEEEKENSDVEEQEEIVNEDESEVIDNNSNPGITDTNEEDENVDISIGNSNGNEILAFLDGFLVAGENCRVYGFNKTKSYMSMKTKEKEFLKVNFKNQYYTMTLSDNSGGYDSISGFLPENNNIDFKIKVSFSKAEIDKNIAMEITVENDSKKKINVELDDKQGKIKMYDRNGSIIASSSEKENLFIL
jgi:hypothetical protein